MDAMPASKLWTFAVRCLPNVIAKFLVAPVQARNRNVQQPAFVLELMLFAGCYISIR
jgi:hypothetical protein